MKQYIVAVVLGVFACSVALANVKYVENFEIPEADRASELHRLFDLLTPLGFGRFKPGLHKLGLGNSAKRLGFAWKNCGHPSTDFIIVKSLTLKDPLHFPGPLTVGFEIVFKTKITSLGANILLREEKEGEWIDVPCIDNIGSCNYTDVCTYAEPIAECPPQFVDNHVPCKCPFNTGTYKLPQSTFDIDAALFLVGKFNAVIKLMLGVSQVGCYEFNVTVTE